MFPTHELLISLDDAQRDHIKGIPQPDGVLNTYDQNAGRRIVVIHTENPPRFLKYPITKLEDVNEAIPIAAKYVTELKNPSPDGRKIKMFHNQLCQFSPDF
ncbi:MAG: hypothetical protein V1858_02530 [Candidatus Gottesmanbacteria bacterium]